MSFDDDSSSTISVDSKTEARRHSNRRSIFDFSPSNHDDLVDDDDENDENEEAELRHRRGGSRKPRSGERRRRFSDSSFSSQMVPFDDDAQQQRDEDYSEMVDSTTNRAIVGVENRRHSDTFGIESYRPLATASKSTTNNTVDEEEIKNGGKSNRPAIIVGQHGARILNQSTSISSPNRSTNEIDDVRLTELTGEQSGTEFVGEFVPRREKKKTTGDIEMEPLLLSAAENDEETSSFVNKAFSGDDEDGDEQRTSSSKNNTVSIKREKKTTKKSEPNQGGSAESNENAFTILLQVSFPFFIAGCGTVGAGLVLDKVQHHRVFEEVPQIFILVPALLGLKGNLEMTLASRLSTLANLGRMDTKKEKLKQVIGNLALIQAQAAVIAFLASVFAIVLGWVPKGEFRLDHALLLCASSLATASMASLILGAIMVAVVLLSKTLRINPDNVATPIAASLGDLTTLALLAAIGGILINSAESFWLSPFIVAVFILLCPLWIWISAKNPVTREVLISGWSPVIFSMLISSAGGFILEYTVAKYRGIAVFQPVINGIGGNLVAVQASRMSTSLHKESRLGVLPSSAPASCFNPCQTFFGSRTHAKAARVLMSLVVPGHLVFMYMIHFLRAGHTPITPMFAILYCTAALIQVSVLLYSCVLMINSMWKKKIDPDNSAIPYLTALGDLLGTALLAIAFHILYAAGDRDADLGD